MKKDRWEKAASAAADVAGRFHLLLLRFLTAALTVFLILVPLTGLWMISNMRRFSAFSDFFGYIRHGASVFSLVLFLFMLECFCHFFGSVLCVGGFGLEKD